MLKPDFLQLLTNSYMERMQYAPQRLGNLETAQEPTVKSITNSNMIINAQKLFRMAEAALADNDFYQIMYDGKPGSGKSNSAAEIALLAQHGGYKTVYSSGFRIFQSPDVFQKRAEGSKKVCAIFDDLSYVMGAVSPKTANAVKSFFGLIRHMLKAKVLVIVIGHFPSAVPPIFKNADTWIFTKPTTLEYDSMIDIVGRGQDARQRLENLFNTLLKIQEEARKNRVVSLRVGPTSYNFTWGNKDAPGDGRLALMISDKRPMLYNSKYVPVELAEAIGFKVNINNDDYNFNKQGGNNDERV